MADEKPVLSKAQSALLRTIVNNVFRSRSELWKNLTGDPRRNLDDECGYDKQPNAHTFYDLFDRGAIPRRVVEVYPKETWQISPLVYEKEDSDQTTEFEAAWDNLGKSIQPEKSWHNREEGSAVWEYLLRADIMSGVGRYGVILLGLDDIGEGEDLSKPVDLKAAAKAKRKLLFLRVFPEHLADITQWEESLASPRFGRPNMYSITFNDPKAGQSAVGLTTMTANVHWTRVVHIAEGLQSGEVFGVERMRPVLNNLRDLNKIFGAAAEGFWKACFTILTAETHPELGGDVEIDDQKMKDMFEEMMNGLQRTGVLTGMSLKSTAPTVSDPTSQITVNIEAICIALGCPVRVFKGSERGELASSQDDDAWNDRLKHRQNTHVTPRIIVPFIDRLIAVGVLPEPGEGYTVEWPDLTSNSDKDKASVALTWTQAISAYTASGAPQLITWLDFLTYIMKVSDDEAAAIVKNAEDAAKGEPSDTGSPLVGMVGGITAMIELYKQAQAGVVTEDQLKAMIALFFKLPSDQVDDLIADGIEPAPQPTPEQQTGKAPDGTELNPPPPKVLPGGKPPIANTTFNNIPVEDFAE